MPNCTVQELCSIIEKETNLPVPYQKIIHNGRTLNNNSKDLSRELKAFGLKSPSKILVLGKTPDEEDENFKIMKKWETFCESSEKQLINIQHDIESIEKV